MNSPYKGKFRVTSIQGMRTLNGVTQMHPGLDLVGEDKHIYAVVGGMVEVSSIIDESTGNDAWAFGNRVMILDNNGKYVMYNHLAKRLVNQGDHVESGDLIGIEGCTGDVYPKGTGVHLHLECRDKRGYGYTCFSAADYIGISNKVGSYEQEPTIVNVPVVKNKPVAENIPVVVKIPVITFVPVINDVQEEINNEPAEWARESVEWAADKSNGILFGDQYGNYRLSKECTRQETMIFLNRLTKLME
jgi:murein DD-endopeptidase MepM/ murein hydrolase activator NlpD